MAEEKISSANLNFEDNKIEFLDASGKPISDEAFDEFINKENSNIEVKESEPVQQTGYIEDKATVAPQKTKHKDDRSITKKIYQVAKTMMRYSPLGMSYIAGKDLMEKFDLLMQGEEIQKDHINLDQLAEMIKIGKYKFGELNLIFTEAQAQDINVRRLRQELNDDNILINFTDRDRHGLEIHIKYKGEGND